MKIYFLAVIFAAVIFAAAAYQAIIPPDPKHPGKCIYEGKELVPGENRVAKLCGILTCNKDGSITISGCGTFSLNDCKPGDLVDESQPFPKCCERFFHCKDKNGVETIEKFSPY